MNDLDHSATISAISLLDPKTYAWLYPFSHHIQETESWNLSCNQVDTTHPSARSKNSEALYIFSPASCPSRPLSAFPHSPCIRRYSHRPSRLTLQWLNTHILGLSYQWNAILWAISWWILVETLLRRPETVLTSVNISTSVYKSGHSVTTPFFLWLERAWNISLPAALIGQGSSVWCNIQWNVQSKTVLHWLECILWWRLPYVWSDPTENKGHSLTCLKQKKRLCMLYTVCL